MYITLAFMKPPSRLSELLNTPETGNRCGAMPQETGTSHESVPAVAR